MNIIFVLLLGAVLCAIFAWSFKYLPSERWQIMATIPLKKHDDGSWLGLNLTYYGVITASSLCFSVVIFLILMEAIQSSLTLTAIAVVVLMALCLPAAKIVARVVEGKQHTFTVAGGVFVGFMLAPPVIYLINVFSTTDQLPIIETMAAMSIAYILGEGVGRLACISFGCCYGKPLMELGPTAQKLFGSMCFSFEGNMKKISYADNMAGVKVVPIQAITSVLYTLVGLASLYLFLESYYIAAFAIAAIFAQGWRVYSETLRADYRGENTFSIYQWMGVIAIAYVVGLIIFCPLTTGLVADLGLGLQLMWEPVVILAIQLFWILAFVFTGTSMVTGCSMSYHIHEDRI